MIEYDENGVEKPKFKVGDLVRASSHLNLSVATRWDGDSPPWYKVRTSGTKRVAWKHRDVGIVTRVDKPKYSQFVYVEVHFIQTGDRIIVKQRELKWAKK